MLQQDAGDPEQSVGDAAQGTTIGVATRPQGFIAAAACVVDLHGDAGPVEHRLSQPNLGDIPHDDNTRLAGALGDRGHARQGSEGEVCPETERIAIEASATVCDGALAPST